MKKQEREQTKQEQPKKKAPLSKILQYGTTGLLVICTLLCFFVVISSTVKRDVSLFGYRLFYVVSGSMEPSIPVGSLLVVKESDTYEVGDVITFYSEEESIQGYPNTHRIIGIITEGEEIKYLTKGDANNTADDPVSLNDVIGKVYLSVDNSFIRGAMEFLGSPVGFFAIILLPVLIFALICMKDFGKALKAEIQNAALASLQEEQVEKEECHKDETETMDTTE